MSTPTTSTKATARDRPPGGLGLRLAIAWTVVGVPLAYGVFETARKASALFTG